MSYVFPDIGLPRVARATNAGESYKMQVQDSTISTTTDAHYKHTRPRTTRMIRTWTFAFNAISQEKYQILLEFFYQVGTFQSFEWRNWIDNKVYSVRFAEILSWQENYPFGWHGTLKFEEV